jgi:hypothetical protein
MMKSFEENLAKLRNVSVAAVRASTEYNILDDNTASVVVNFSDGTVLKTDYWRLIQDRRALLSNFDHKQKYGLPAPIDAKGQLSNLLEGKICQNVQFDSETGDLTLIFGQVTKLQVFNFTGYEVWEIGFPVGTGAYSDSALS